MCKGTVLLQAQTFLCVSTSSRSIPGNFRIRSDDVRTASQSDLPQLSRLAVQAISQVQHGLVDALRTRIEKNSGAPAEDWPERPPPDLKHRMSISKTIERQAKKIFQAAEQCTSVEQKAHELCHCYAALRLCCSELHYEIEQSAEEAEFWRNETRGLAEVRLQEAREEAAEAEKRTEAIQEWQKAVKSVSALQDKIIHLIELERSGEEEETNDEIWVDSDGELQIRWRKELSKKSSRFFWTGIDKKVNRVGWPWLPKGVTVSEERKAAVMEEAFREMREVYEGLQRELARSAAEAESLRRAAPETWNVGDPVTNEGGQVEVENDQAGE
ncbi:hypothetical protein KFL_000780285 [Klebsormidium nitens]|uniref:Uncharacterized protein n=1 Tax=Klebsormidium nitens TaxID=105231 RepID=A0A1Y1HXW8_KLENI|nr:hypothetical protein KFL_000780285 [Klebsormidium nitens]|eukprot:GAQ81366.1 hypothetical protein KFL_000780285 [Klebsormidium nitens]